MIPDFKAAGIIPFEPVLKGQVVRVVTTGGGIDVTTGRNLIDSMGTEVLVTDHSIRDLVPGEPLAYDEAVRRALEE